MVVPRSSLSAFAGLKNSQLMVLEGSPLVLIEADVIVGEVTRSGGILISLKFEI